MVEAKNFKLNKKYTVTLMDGTKLKCRCIEIQNWRVLLGDCSEQMAGWFKYEQIKSIK